MANTKDAAKAAKAPTKDVAQDAAAKDDAEKVEMMATKDDDMVFMKDHTHANKPYAEGDKFSEIPAGTFSASVLIRLTKGKIIGKAK